MNAARQEQEKLVLFLILVVRRGSVTQHAFQVARLAITLVALIAAIQEQETLVLLKTGGTRWGTVNQHALQVEKLVIHRLRDKKLTWRLAAIQVKFVNNLKMEVPLPANPHA